MSSSDHYNSVSVTPEAQQGSGVDSSRRRLLRAAGSAAVLIPTVSLFGCSGDEKPAATAAEQAKAVKEEAAAAVSKAQGMANDVAEQAGSAMDSAMDSMQGAADSAKQAAGDAVDAAQGAMDSAADAVSSAAGGLAKIEESDPVAKALAYVHDASRVDKAAQPRFAAGQACENCAQYKAVEGGWGSCAIFPGKLVASAGWCAGYIATS